MARRTVRLYRRLPDSIGTFESPDKVSQGGDHVTDYGRAVSPCWVFHNLFHKVHGVR